MNSIQFLATTVDKALGSSNNSINNGSNTTEEVIDNEDDIITKKNHNNDNTVNDINDNNNNNESLNSNLTNKQVDMNKSALDQTSNEKNLGLSYKNQDIANNNDEINPSGGLPDSERNRDEIIVNRLLQKMPKAINDDDIVTRADPSTIHHDATGNYNDDEDDEEEEEGVEEEEEDDENAIIYEEDEYPSRSLFGKILDALLFLPKYMIYKPIVFVLWIIFYPFIFLYRLIVPKTKKKSKFNKQNYSLDEAEDKNNNNSQSHNSPYTFRNKSKNLSTSSSATSTSVSPRISNNVISPTISTISEDDIEFELPSYTDDSMKSPTTDVPYNPDADTLNDGLSLNSTLKSDGSISSGPFSSSRTRSPLSKSNNNSSRYSRSTTPILSSSATSSSANTNLSTPSSTSKHPNNNSEELALRSPQKQMRTRSRSRQPNGSHQLGGTSSSSIPSSNRNIKTRFLFPRILFGNFNILNPPQVPLKTLVLDLDETLIHSLSRQNSAVLGKSKGTTIEIKLSNSIAALYYIYKRPYVDEFLTIVSQWFNLVCFTASIKEYADPVINYLETEYMLKNKKKITDSSTNGLQNGGIFQKRLYRDHCKFIEGEGYIKDLTVLLPNTQQQQQQQQQNANISNSQNPSSSRSRTSGRESNVSSRESSTTRSRSRSATLTGRPSSSGTPLANSNSLDLSKIIIIDNSPVSYSMHQENGIMIEGWINDPDDIELMNLLPLLNSLRFVSDVRSVLGLKHGQNAFD
ncbi:hypothetical protein B5S33_g3822 [[Candida] boidinii]|nr:hypothetical protein B5S30_g3912 [[Candida] boidinii]OWB85164.1 hypothetical protein B5S33_g3822 [[Candida] boidinii]GMF97557.1 unnamed protein product [[Candida] boidinii]